MAIAASGVTGKKPVRYVAIVGLTLKSGDRVERGDVYPGRPPKWLLEQGKVKRG
jgi:hypothetical protein